MCPKKRLLAVSFALILIVGIFNGCGTATVSSGGNGSAESSLAVSAGETAVSTDQLADETTASSDQEEPPADSEESDIEIEGSDVASSDSAIPEAEPAYTISYPIEGGHTISMTGIYGFVAQSVFEDGSHENAYCFPLLEEKTGINIDFTMIAESSFYTTLTLMINSGDYPDLLNRTTVTYDSNPMKGIEDGILLDVSDLLEENAPDYYALLQRDKAFRDDVAGADGSISRVAKKSADYITSGLTIRQDWLDELGLDVPTNIDELTDVMRAFQRAYGCELGILINKDVDSGLGPAFNVSSGSINMLGFQLDAPGSDTVVASLASDGWIDLLQKLHEYYEEGLINDSFLNISKENNNLYPTIWGGLTGIWADNAQYNTAAKSGVEGWKISGFNLDGDNYHMVGSNVMNMIMVVSYITTNCQEPEIALQFLNYGFTEEGQDFIGMGVEDVTYTRAPDGTTQFTDLMLNNPDGLNFSQAEIYYLVDGWMPYLETDTVFRMARTDDVMACYDVWSNPVGDSAMVLPTTVKLSADETSTVAEYAGDVLTLFQESASKVIMGDMDEAGYRDVIDQAIGAGLDIITEQYQNAYDRYLENQ